MTDRALQRADVALPVPASGRFTDVLAGVVARAAEFVTAGEVRPGSATFADLASVSDPLEIRKAAWIRVILGKADGTFDPEVPVRRDQAASMMTRLLDRLTQHGLMDVA